MKTRYPNAADVPEPLKAHYIALADGSAMLDTDYPDPLARAILHEARERHATTAKVTRLQADIAALPAAAPEPDAKALEAARAAIESTAQRNIAEAVGRVRAECEAKIASLAPDVDRLLIGQEAARIIAKIGAPGAGVVLKPHVVARLRVAVGADNVRSVVVVDERGEPSTLTLDGLCESLRRDSTFQPIIRDGATEQAANAQRVAETLGTIKPNGALH